MYDVTYNNGTTSEKVTQPKINKTINWVNRALINTQNLKKKHLTNKLTNLQT